MGKNAKHDPLEAAKITGDRAAADVAALGATMPVDPRFPAPAATGDGGPVEAGQFVQPPTTPETAEKALRDDGPTIEMFIAAGYHADDYPPRGYAEKPSPGLTRYKAGGPIDQEWIDAARAEYERIEAGDDAPAPPKHVVYVVLADGHGNCGHGQRNFFRKGDVLQLAGYGERGIKRLLDSGLKLEREER